MKPTSLLSLALVLLLCINGHAENAPLTRINLPKLNNSTEEANSETQSLEAPLPNASRFVTFQVDMSVQKAIGRFQKEKSSVRVAGTFNGWSVKEGYLELAETGDSLYLGSLPISGPIGTVVKYKFYLETPQDNGSPKRLAENVPPREFKLTHNQNDQTLPPSYFSDLQARTVAFHVSAQDLIDKKEIEPKNGALAVIGEFNKWDTERGKIPLNYLGNGIFSGSGFLYGPEGARVQYRFFNPSPQAPNGGIEPGETPREMYLKKGGKPQNTPLTRFGSSFRLSQ